VNKWDAVEKDSYTIYDYNEQLKERLHFTDWAETVYVSAHTGQRVDKILDLVDTAAEQHKRRVSTSVINEVLEEALSWHTPPTTRQGRQGRIYYGTQVTSQPPTIALFVNDPKLFNDNFRRYTERQFRQHLGFTGTPLKLLWRGKKMRELDRTSPNRATKTKTKV
ncbi:MAG TPA: ribosome biogenesis GTPase Der, partial [Coleofasciculaceae cyanobacterium]